MDTSIGEQRFQSTYILTYMQEKGIGMTISFNDLIRATDKFYVIAMNNLPFKIAAPEEDRYSQMWNQMIGSNDNPDVNEKDAYTKMEDVWDQIQNNDLANQFENYLKAYKEFVDSLKISPQEFSAILYGADTSEKDTWVDYLDALQKRYERIISMPYLQLDPEDPKWEESLSSSEISNAIETIAKDANDHMYALAGQEGITPDNIEEALGSKRQGEFMAPTEEIAVNKEIDFANRKQQNQKENEKKSRNKRNSVGKIGLENVTRQREQLEQEIATETNLIKKEELQRRLKALPDPKSYSNKLNYFRERNKSIMMDKNKREQFIKERDRRKTRSRKLERELLNGVKKYDEEIDPQKREEIKASLVQLKKEQLKRRGINLDDEWVKNDPSIMDQLDPDNIIESYMELPEKVIDRERDRLKERQKKKKEGKLDGLIIKYNQRISDLVQNVKDRLNNQLSRMPDVAKYKKAISVAKESGDNAALAIAEKQASAFCEVFKTNHKLTREVVAVVSDMRKWKDELVQLDKTNILESGTISDESKELIRKLISDGIELVRKYSANKAASSQITVIVEFLAKGLEQ